MTKLARRKYVVFLLIAVFLLASCGPTEAELLEAVRGTSTPAASSAAAAEGAETPDILTPLATEQPVGNPPPVGCGTVTLDFAHVEDLRAEPVEIAAVDKTYTVFSPAFSKELEGGNMYRNNIAVYESEVYRLNPFPSDLAVPPSEYNASWNAAEPVLEVYDIANPSAGKRVISLQRVEVSDSEYLTVYAFTVDEDGIFTYGRVEDGSFMAEYPDSFLVGAAHFDKEGKLLDYFTFTQDSRDAAFSLFRIGGELYIFVVNSIRDIQFHQSYGWKDDMTPLDWMLDEAFYPYSRDAGQLCRIDPEKGVVPYELPSHGNTSIINVVKYSDTQMLVFESTLRANPDAPDPLRPDTCCPVAVVSLYTPADGSYEPLCYTFTGSSRSGASIEFSRYITYDATTGILFVFNYSTRHIYAWQIYTDAPITPLWYVASDHYQPMLYADKGVLLYSRSWYGLDTLSDLSLPVGNPITPGDDIPVIFAKLPGAKQLKVATNALDGASPSRIFNYLKNYFVETGAQEYELSSVTLGPRTNDMSAIAPEYYDALALKLLAGDDDFDMFFLGGQNYWLAANQINGMLKNGYLLSMEDLGLAHLYDDMLPGVKELCTADGAILLAPISFAFDGYSVNKEALSLLNLRVDTLPHTAAAFTDTVLDRKAAFTQAGVALYEDRAASRVMRWYERQYVTVFMENEADTQVAWDAMLYALDGLFASGLMAFEIEDFAPDSVPEPYKGSIIDYTKSLFSRGFNLVTGSGMPLTAAADNPSVFMPYPKLTDGAKNHIWEGLFLAVNPRSKNLDDVKVYLETILSRAFRQSTYNGGAGSCPWLIYDEPEFTEHSDYHVYTNMLANSTRGYIGAADETQYIAYADYMAYRDGKLSASEWKVRVDRELEFLRDE